MIESNLAVLLAERNLKISKVSADTGISRTTLTALCNDYTGGIKFETLDVLCKYLNTDPSDFFNYTAYDYEITVRDGEGITECEDIIEVSYMFDVDVILDNYRWHNEIVGFGSVSITVPNPKMSVFFEDGGSDNPTREEEKAFEHLEQMSNEMSPRQRAIFDLTLKTLMKEQILKELPAIKAYNVEFIYNSYLG